MKCPECQAENPDGAEYCYLCYARFGVKDETSGRDEIARGILEKEPGSRIRCPNCGELSPVKSHLCLKCGYAFEDIETLLVGEEEVARLEQRKKGGTEGEVAEQVLSEPVNVTPESDGAAIMRGIEDILSRNQCARLQARGRNATTYAMKIIALVSEEHRKQDRRILMEIKLITEGAITHLDDVELEIIILAG
ncbi:MAG: zinc ribbon domain-containing protein [Actinomycetota bacterium]|nr:zinc ribbon domain-containing protein [Actinomycetota bacterium]